MTWLLLAFVWAAGVPSPDVQAIGDFGAKNLCEERLAEAQKEGEQMMPPGMKFALRCYAIEIPPQS